LRDPTFSRLNTIPECDRDTDRHTTTAYTALSIASRDKNHEGNYKYTFILRIVHFCVCIIVDNHHTTQHRTVLIIFTPKFLISIIAQIEYSIFEESG